MAAFYKRDSRAAWKMGEIVQAAREAPKEEKGEKKK